jgi:hypothetical protein
MKFITLLTTSTLTFLSMTAFAKTHTTALEIADVVTSLDSLNKKIVGLSSVSTQKFSVSKIEVTKAESHNDIGVCRYEYTVYLSNIDSEVKAALKGDDFFTGQQNTKGKCQF